MSGFSVIDEKGMIVAVVTCPENAIEANKLSYPGYRIVDEIVSQELFYYKNDTFRRYPDKPDFECFFDFETEAWVRDFDAAIINVRARRDKLLQQSDWTQIQDVSLQNKEAWAVYRQSLRDITKQAGYPFDVIWPASPEGKTS